MKYFYITPEQKQIAEQNGISYHRLYQRVYDHGWNIERAITEPVQKQRKGLWSEWKDIAEQHGVKKHVFYDRICPKKSNMSPYEAATKPMRKRKKVELNESVS